MSGYTLVSRGIMIHRKQKINWSILLHDIRSVQNVASIFRMSEIFGIKEIFLSGITPGFKDRFERIREDFVKISLGTENLIKINTSLQVESLEESEKNFKKIIKFINDFKKDDGIVIALEQNKNSIDYKKVKIDKSKKYLIIPGREVEGLDERILKLCDIVAEIPQYGKKESLNIFSAMSILTSRLFDK